MIDVIVIDGLSLALFIYAPPAYFVFGTVCLTAFRAMYTMEKAVVNWIRRQVVWDESLKNAGHQFHGLAFNFVNAIKGARGWEEFRAKWP